MWQIRVRKKIHKLVLTRTTPIPYPLNYGFLFFFDENKRTLWEDGDEMDVICLGSETANLGCIIPIRIIGILKMTDTGKRDEKILAVSLVDEKTKQIKNISEIKKEIINKIENFFNCYKEKKENKNKIIEIKGWGDETETLKLIEENQKRYKKINKKITFFSTVLI